MSKVVIHYTWTSALGAEPLPSLTVTLDFPSSTMDENDGPEEYMNAGGETIAEAIRDALASMTTHGTHHYKVQEEAP